MEPFEMLMYAVAAVLSSLTIVGIIGYKVAAYLDKKHGHD